MVNDPHAAVSQAQAAMAAFRSTFGVDLSVGALGEVLAAVELNLTLTDQTTTPGYDATDQDGTRYQIKCRADTTPNVDMNNFDFDYLVLVNLDASYQVREIWRITAEQAQAITTERTRHHRYQTTQAKIKEIGVRIR